MRSHRPSDQTIGVYAESPAKVCLPPRSFFVNSLAIMINVFRDYYECIIIVFFAFVGTYPTELTAHQWHASSRAVFIKLCFVSSLYKVPLRL